MLKYQIITFGCQMNKADSERIATTLEKKGYKPTKDSNKANLVLINMCSVRQSAVDRVYGKINNLKKIKVKNPKLKTILTGCILKKDKRKFEKFFDEIWSNKNHFKEKAKCQNKSLAFVPISNGCNNACTYCVVPYTRGALNCRSHKEILKEAKSFIKKGLNPIRNAISNGAREIWLLGQNVNDYHSPTNKTINFARLLDLINDIPGNFRILFTSPHPKNFSDELIESLDRCQKFGNYLNIPVQSGNDQILKKMNRNYTAKEYRKLIEKIKKKIPKIKLSTDIIVGFPGETKKQFQDTVKLFKEIKFNWAYISKYSPRPGTAAFKLKDDISLSEKKKRETILREILKKAWKIN
ncbi:MAG: MiaB/RimO family radical SAM methylthiotransferase [Candidatus Pacebacteria bacterium]|nr:MiaB/RimO family radical SAM methylthiotransferase [Candidatus Paceibacterota bacterium]